MKSFSIFVIIFAKIIDLFSMNQEVTFKQVCKIICVIMLPSILGWILKGLHLIVNPRNLIWSGGQNECPVVQAKFFERIFNQIYVHKL